MIEILIQQLKHNQFASGGLMMMVIATITGTLYKIIPFIKHQFRKRFITNITIDSKNHEMYHQFSIWIEDQPFSNNLRKYHVIQDVKLIEVSSISYNSMSLKSERIQNFLSNPSSIKEMSSHEFDIINDTSENTKYDYILSPGEGTHFFFYDKTLFVLNKSRIEAQNDIVHKYSIDIYTGNVEKVKKFLKQIYVYKKKPNERKTFIYYGDDKGWSGTIKGPMRPIDSVILDEAIKKKLIFDINKFLNNRSYYTNLGISYRRGYLLYGPPGTGKTSIIKSIAGEFGLYVYIVNLSQLNEYSLQNMISNISPNSIVLFEDIDRYRFSDTDKGISLKAFINAIDGITTPESVLTFMTANNPEKLDKALIRAGRVDLKIKIDYISSESAKVLMKRMMNENHHIYIDYIIEKLFNYGINLSGADIQQFCTTYEGNPCDYIEEFLMMQKESKFGENIELSNEDKDKNKTLVDHSSKIHNTYINGSSYRGDIVSKKDLINLSSMEQQEKFNQLERFQDQERLARMNNLDKI